MSAAIAIQTMQTIPPIPPIQRATGSAPRSPKVMAAAKQRAKSAAQGSQQVERVEPIPQVSSETLAELTRLVEAATATGDGLAWIAAHAGTWSLLSAQEELALARRAGRGDRQAREELTLRNLRLVLHIALRMQRYSGALEVCDLAQEGVIGLMRAIGKFNPDRGYRLSTYVTWWITQAMQRAVADTGRTIRLPVYLYHQRRILLRLSGELVEELHREPTMDELAAAFNARPNRRGELREAGRRLTGEDVALVLLAGMPVTSLQASVDPSDPQSAADAAIRPAHKRIGDLVADERASAAYESVDAQAQSSWLLQVAQEALAGCSKRDREIFFSRALHPEIALETLGRRYHITRERTRQIEEATNARVRSALIAIGAGPAGYVAETPAPKRRPGRQPLKVAPQKATKARAG